MQIISLNISYNFYFFLQDTIHIMHTVIAGFTWKNMSTYFNKGIAGFCVEDFFASLTVLQFYNSSLPSDVAIKNTATTNATTCYG